MARVARRKNAVEGKPAAKPAVRYGIDGYDDGVTAAQLKRLGKEKQRSTMEMWFRDRFEDPAQSTPHDSGEGGYQYIHGGPYEADDVLREEFEGIVSDALIEALANDLNEESWEWAPVLGGPFDESDYEPAEEPEEVDAIDALPIDFDIAGAPGFSNAQGKQLRKKVLDAIGRVEEALLETIPAAGSRIGHNQPPEPIESDAVPAALRKLHVAVLELKTEVGTKRPRASHVKSTARKIKTEELKLRKYIDIFMTEAAKSSGKAYGKEVGKGLGTATVAAVCAVVAALLYATNAWVSYLLP